MKQQSITALYFLIHPFCYAWYEDRGEPFPDTAPFFDNGRFERYLDYERTLRERWNDAISRMGEKDALVILPIDSFRSQHDLEELAKGVLGPRCVMLTTHPFGSEAFSTPLEPEFKIKVADDLLAAFQSRGYSWHIQDMKIAVFSRAYVQAMRTAFHERGLTFDPAMVRSEAWGESFEGCVTKWSNGLGTYLHLERPIEKEFGMTMPDAPYLLTARFVERVPVRDDVRLFLFEGNDACPIGVFLKTTHHVWDRLLVAQLPADSAAFEVRRKTDEVMWPVDGGTDAAADGMVEVPVYGGSYSDEPTYIFGKELRVAEFRERLMALSVVEK